MQERTIGVGGQQVGAVRAQIEDEPRADIFLQQLGPVLSDRPAVQVLGSFGGSAHEQDPAVREEDQVEDRLFRSEVPKGPRWEVPDAYESIRRKPVVDATPCRR